jgi:zinc transporter ZupT
MKPKQAIVYNVVSSVLAFCGMLIGVMIGNIESASLWIFTVVGGMFLYVALVDMVNRLLYKHNMLFTRVIYFVIYF